MSSTPSSPTSPLSPVGNGQRTIGFSFRSLLERRTPRRRFRNRFHYSAALKAADPGSPKFSDGQQQQAWTALWDAISNGGEIQSDDNAATLACERWRRKEQGERNDVWARLSSSFKGAHTEWERLTFNIRSGVPASLRASVWYACSGASSSRREAGKSYAELAELGMALTNEAAGVIEVDLPRTGVGEEQMSQLRRILRAFAAKNPHIGYCQSMNFIAKTLLLYNSEEPTFWTLCSLIENLLPPDYYTQTMSGLRCDLRLLDSLIGNYLPTLKGHLVARGIDLAPITMNWFLCLFVNTLPAEESHRVLDCLLHEGPKVLFRAALSLLHMHEQELLLTESVVDTYGILRSPFGTGRPVVAGESFEAERPQTNLLASMYGPWLMGFSTKKLVTLREEHAVRIRIEDQEHAARREAWRQTQAEKKEQATPKQDERPTSAPAPNEEDGEEAIPQQPAQLRAQSFALVENLPSHAKAMGHEERPADNPSAAASWLANLTGDHVDELGNDHVVNTEETAQWDKTPRDPRVSLEGASPAARLSLSLWCCRVSE